MFLVNLLLTPISELSEILDQTQTAIAGWRKILGVLATPVDVVEPDGRRRAARRARSPVRPRRRAASPTATGGEVLRGIDLDLPAGTTVAVVGETGSGKTTIAKLLCRLADPTAGTVLVGGRRPARRSTPPAAVAPSAWCPQDGFLFDTTLAENVRLGRVDADDAEVAAAFDALGLGGWLDDLPGGLDAEVGERGGNLSVGERQLVALARAQLGDPGLLILDEATSSVDPETEQALAEALEPAGRGPHRGQHRPPALHRGAGRPRARRRRAARSSSGAPTTSWWPLGGVYARLYESWLGNTRAHLDQA